jgi:uncharacterized membrane protein YccC
MSSTHHLDRAEVRLAVLDCGVLAIACLFTYLVATTVLSHLYFLSRADSLLGGLWAVIATVFVSRDSYQHSMGAAVSRMSGTLVSFLFCLIYLSMLPFHVWALPVLIGASALAVTLLGRPGDAATAAITAAVVLIVADVSPHDAWEQPILRFFDTLIGVLIGVATAWVTLRVLHPRVAPAARPGSPSSPGGSERQA